MKTSSTWWVGRGEKPRAWWRDSVPLVFVLGWFAFSSILDKGGLSWSQLGLALIAFAHVGWLYWCHRTGRDPDDTRFDRWAKAHRAWLAVFYAAFLAACIAFGIWLHS